MTAVCEFVIPGSAQGKGRPRVFNGRGVTPAKTRSQEGYIRALAAQAMTGRMPHEGPCSVSVAIVKAIPSGWPSWKRDAAESGLIRPTGRPDPDNVAKLVCDALNGIVWGDDAQIVGLGVVRRWGSRDETYVGVFAEPGLCASVKTRRALEAARQAQGDLWAVPVRRKGAA